MFVFNWIAIDAPSLALKKPFELRNKGAMSYDLKLFESLNVHSLAYLS